MQISQQWITATVLLLVVYWWHILCYYHSARHETAVDHSHGPSTRGVLVALTVLLSEHARRACSGAQRHIYWRCIGGTYCVAVLQSEHASRACSGSQRLSICSGCIAAHSVLLSEHARSACSGSQRRSICSRCIGCTYGATIGVCERCLQWITATVNLLEVLVALAVLLSEHVRSAYSGSQRRCIGCTCCVIVLLSELVRSAHSGPQRRSIYLRCIGCTYSATIGGCEKSLCWITATAHLLKVYWWRILLIMLPSKLARRACSGSQRQSIC